MPNDPFILDTPEGVTYNVDWNASNKKIAVLDPPDLNSRLTGQNISVATMLDDLTIEYIPDPGYYILKFHLDVSEEATKESLKTLRAGVGNDSAHYVGMNEEFHIWDNGFPKYFRSRDSWDATKGILSLHGDLDYNCYYYYSDFACDYNNYQYMAEFKAQH